MSSVKRTYNLSPETVRRVRELAEGYGAATSQDGVVELAIERLYRDVVDREESERWSRAADDPDFRQEMSDIDRAYGDRGSWPA
jgi:hypothetical protein